jgi:serine/threonine protein kinase
LLAVKLVHPHLAQDAQFRRRFAEEVAAARRVGGFYTAQVVDADTDADPPWLVTAYIPSPSLHEAVQVHGPLPEDTIPLLGAGLAEGLAAIHASGLVHRDLTPRNVLLADDGPRVIDFGIARAIDATHTGTIIGTPPLMSPEQAQGQVIGPSSDVFSLACVLTFAATGHSPFATRSVIDVEPDLSDLPTDLTGLIAASLSKDPAARPSISDILDRLAVPDGTTAQWLPPDVTAMITMRDDAARTFITGPASDPPAPSAKAPSPEGQNAPPPALYSHAAILTGDRVGYGTGPGG